MKIGNVPGTGEPGMRGGIRGEPKPFGVLIAVPEGPPISRNPPLGLCSARRPEHHCRGSTSALDDTAALVASLALVISVNTAVALAGALGRPAWALSR